jgi:hypothetical protein
VGMVVAVAVADSKVSGRYCFSRTVREREERETYAKAATVRQNAAGSREPRPTSLSAIDNAVLVAHAFKSKCRPVA